MADVSILDSPGIQDEEGFWIYVQGWAQILGLVSAACSSRDLKWVIFQEYKAL